MRKRMVLFSFMTAGLLGHAQSHLVKAKVTDGDQLVSMGNILALSILDSSLITGTYFVDGNAELTVNTEADFLLNITALGYASSMVRVSPESGFTDLGEVQLVVNNELAEVEITAFVPLFEQKIGATIINVQQTMLSSSNSVLEILAKSPNVMVKGNDVAVGGKGEALIYMKGQRITVDQLKSIPVDQVENIEVITNPSAKYDADGAAVIIVHLVENHMEGYSGNLSQTITGMLPLSYSEASFQFHKKKISLDANYSASFGHLWERESTDYTINDEQGRYVSRTKYKTDINQKNVSNYHLGTTYQANDNHQFTLAYSGYINNNLLGATSDNERTEPNKESKLISTSNSELSEQMGNSGNVNYSGTLDSLGSSLFVGGQYFNHTGVTASEIDEDQAMLGASSSAIRQINGQSDVEISSAQIDYVKAWSKWKISTGLKYSNVLTAGEIKFRSKDAGSSDWLSYPDLTNGFHYDERVPAGYIDFSGSMDSTLQCNLGVRSEYSIIEGNSVKFSKPVIDTSYINFFPSASISKSTPSGKVYGLTYSSRISRPDFEDLDPFIFYMDTLTSIQGNPYLKPEYSHSVEGTAILGFADIMTGFVHHRNPSQFVIIEGDTATKSVLMQMNNIQASNFVYFNVAVPVSFKFWTARAMVSLRRMQFVDNRPGFEIGAARASAYAYLFNEISLPKDFSLEITGELFTPHKDGIRSMKSTYMLSAAVARSFLDDRLTCRFMANDILSSYREWGSYELGKMKTDFDYRSYTHYFRLSISYDFGKLEFTNYDDATINDDEVSRIKTEVR